MSRVGDFTIKVFYGGLLVFLSVPFCSEAAAGEKLALSIYGEMAPTGPLDFFDDVFQSGCLKDLGWNQVGTVSDSSASYKKSAAVRAAMTALGSTEPAAPFNCEGDKMSDDQSHEKMREAGDKAVESYLAFIRDKTRNLKAGDQFLFKLSAHGVSNCEGGDREKGPANGRGLSRISIRTWSAKRSSLRNFASSRNSTGPIALAPIQATPTPCPCRKERRTIAPQS